MLSHLFNQMDEYLSNKPFIHRWWSRRWIAHMTIQPPLTKDYPLWKRNKDGLRLLRLFDLSPEELSQKKEFQEVEVLMFHYYQLWHFNAFSSRRFEVGIDLVNDRAINENQERKLAKYINPQTISSSLAPTHRIVTQAGIGSLHESKKQKVEELLQTSMNDIKTITELHLGYCETKLLNIEGRHEAYGDFIEYLDDLQRRLPLLQGGMLLFHPDHMRNLTHSQEMWEMITRYSQSYLEQSRYYLDSLKNYHLRIEALYHHSHQELQRQQALRDWSDLARRIQELGQSIKELEQSFKELDKKRTEEIERFREKLYDQWEKDKAEIRADLEQDKLEEIEAKIRGHLNAKLEQGIEKGTNSDDNHVNEKATFISDSAEKLINRPSF